jgi:DNA-binding CsgD family transcriptional regulator
MDLAEYFFKELQLSEALVLVDASIANAEKANRKDVYARCLSLKGYLIAHQGKSREGFEMANNAVNIALEKNDTLATAEAYRRLAGTLEYASSFHDSLKAYYVAFRFCSTNQFDYHETQCLSCMAWVLLRVGDWRKCFETCRNVLEHPGSMDISKCTANTILAVLRAYRGEFKTAKKNLNEAFVLADKVSSVLHRLVITWPASIIHILEGNNSKAYQGFCEMIETWAGSDDLHDAIPGFCDAVSFFATHNYLTELNKCIHALSSIANETRNPEAFGILSFAIGASLELKKQSAQATEHFEKAIEYLEPVQIPLQMAIVKYHLGLSYLNLNQLENAHASFQSGYQAFKNLGIRYWCSLIDQQFQKTANKDERVQKAVSPSHLSANLTERQLEILGHLTTGLSNKEIAAKTYLSTRTVDMHVRNIYDRLNCRTRAEATKIAIDSGLVKSHP